MFFDRQCCLLGFVGVLIAVAPVRGNGQDGHGPLDVARQIDTLVDRKLDEAGLPASPLADDAEFLRRVSLLLTGRIPTAAEAADFLDDDAPDKNAPDKRRKLVDRLVQRPEYGRHFGTVWHNLIAGRESGMARPPDTRLLARWLRQAFRDNRPWDQLARDILTAQGSHGKNPATIFFTLNGDSRGAPQPNVIAGTVGQLFLGVQFQCAECHDHPFSDWSQDEFWGVAAFFGRVKLSSNKGGAKRKILETPFAPGQPAAIKIPEASFTNVGHQVPVNLPSTDAAVDLDERWSLRTVFAEWLTDPQNPFFARNMVNRIWAHFFGRGLVTPLNDFRPDNPATHPELLDLLSREFVASGFDQRHLIRCICASRTFQRTSRPLPDNQDDQRLLSHMRVTVLSPEMLLDSLSTALEGEVLSDERPKMDFRNPLLPLYSPREKVLRLFKTKSPGGDPTQYTHGVPQLLFLMNSPRLNQGTPVVARLVDEGVGAKQGVEHLYLATLSRRPDGEEMQAAVEFIESQAGLREGFDGVLWSLLNRSEFMLNH